MNFVLEAGKSNYIDSALHFGIQVKDTDAIEVIRKRFLAGEYRLHDEENITCCYAKQTKFWVQSPDHICSPSFESKLLNWISRQIPINLLVI